MFAFLIAGCDGGSLPPDDPADLDWQADRSACTPLEISANSRYFVTAQGKPVLIISDTAWELSGKLSRSEIREYLEFRTDQGFNALGMKAFTHFTSTPNAYGDFGFERNGDEYDLEQPLETAGMDPRSTEEYDFWDHASYAIDRACEYGVTVFFNPVPGEFVHGGYSENDTSRIKLNVDNAYDYGRWIGNRIGHRNNLIWMLGGDRSAVTASGDYRAVVRALAEGVTDGVTGEGVEDGAAHWDATMMSYWPRKSMPDMHGPNSSEWFHNDPWLDFNSVQDWPWDQVASIEHDFGLEPKKPTWLWEGRYEGYRPVWTEQQVRYQAYQSIFAGGFGHQYGHETLFHFGSDIGKLEADPEQWRAALASRGSEQFSHIRRLFAVLSDEQQLDRVPGNDMLAGPQGHIGSLRSSWQQVARGRNYAMVYTAAGQDVNLVTDKLDATALQTHWFNPRNGRWWGPDGSMNGEPVVVDEVAVADGAVTTFEAPGEARYGNDWVLVLLPVE